MCQLDPEIRVATHSAACNAAKWNSLSSHYHYTTFS